MVSTQPSALATALGSARVGLHRRSILCSNSLIVPVRQIIMVRFFKVLPNSKNVKYFRKENTTLICPVFLSKES
jgi:hypothetical protein